MTDELELYKQPHNELALIPQDARTILEAIGSDLGEMFDQMEAAGDEQAMQVLSTMYQRAEQLAAHVSTQAGALQSLLTIADEIRQQRDAIGTEHATLVEAVKSLDRDHPLADTLYDHLYEQAQEDAYEWMSYGWAEGIHDDEPGLTAEENGHLGEMDAASIEAFMYMVYGTSDNLPEEMEAELAAFMRQFVDRAEAYWHEKYNIGAAS